MIEGFENLSENQFTTLKKSVSWITVLIAGADGSIDESETEWAKKLTEIRGYANPSLLNAFYDEVGKNFSEELKSLMDHVPFDTKDRTQLLTRKLEELNAILPLLDNRFALELYFSLKSFAKHVAKSTGGFLGFFSINKEEAKLIELPMITPIELAEEEE